MNDDDKIVHLRQLTKVANVMRIVNFILVTIFLGLICKVIFLEDWFVDYLDNRPFTGDGIHMPNPTNSVWQLKTNAVVK